MRNLSLSLTIPFILIYLQFTSLSYTRDSYYLHNSSVQVLLYPVQVSVHPGVDPGEVWPPALHSEAGHPNHAPPRAQAVRQQGAARVTWQEGLMCFV